MRKAIVAVIFLMTISVGAFAQGRGGQRERISPEKRAEMQTKRMTDELGLTEDQQKKVLALNVDRNKKAEEIGREDAEKRKEVRETYTKELNGVLTPEQQEKLKAVQKEGRGPREAGQTRGGRQGKRPSKPQN